jgi:hypothetical protein
VPAVMTGRPGRRAKAVDDDGSESCVAVHGTAPVFEEGCGREASRILYQLADDPDRYVKRALFAMEHPGGTAADIAEADGATKH